MNKLLLLILLSFVTPALAAGQPTVIYWNTGAGKVMRARMPADADYWQLAPVFVAQKTQSYCSVASAVTVLNALPIKRPVDPIYAPYAYFTQRDFFTPAVSRIIDAKTVLAQGMTREQMAATLRAQGVQAKSIAEQVGKKKKGAMARPACAPCCRRLWATMASLCWPITCARAWAR